MNKNAILIIDDNPTNLKLVKIILTLENYEVKTAVNADEALQQLLEFNPGLILMDLQLPDIDGFQLTRILKSNPKYQHIKILAVTAYAMKGDKERALSAGCDGYISKPIDTKHLVTEIARYLSVSSS